MLASSLIHTPNAGDPCSPPQTLMTPASFLNTDVPCFIRQMLATPAILLKCWWPLLPSPMLMNPATLPKCWWPLLPSPNADDPCYSTNAMTPASFIAIRAATPSCPLHQSASIFVGFFVFSRREKLCKNARDILFFGLYGTACNGQFLHSRCHGYLERWITLACSAWYIKHARICRRAWMCQISACRWIFDKCEKNY